MTELLDRESDFRTRVLQAYDGLPPQQQVVADFLLEHVREVSFLSVPEVATRCGVSEATIVRFAQRVGYDGFSGLKSDLAGALRERVAPGLPPAAEALAADPNADALGAVAAQELANIQHTVGDLDRKVLREVADALYDATLVCTWGLGISAHLADLLSYMLTQIGVRAATLSTRFSVPLEGLVALQPSDLVVLFAFPPYSKPTIELAKHLAERGTTLVAITDRATSPIARVSTHCLTVRTDNMMFTNSFAAVSVLLNGLVTEAALRHRDRSGAAVTAITSLLDEHDEVLTRVR